jgi:hypothetical protein
MCMAVKCSWALLHKLLGAGVYRGWFGGHRAGIFGIELTCRMNDKLLVCMAYCVLLDILLQ